MSNIVSGAGSAQDNAKEELLSAKGKLLSEQPSTEEAQSPAEDDRASSASGEKDSGVEPAGIKEESLYKRAFQLPLFSLGRGISNATGIPNPIMLVDTVDEVRKGLSKSNPLKKRVLMALAVIVLIVLGIARLARHL